MCGSGERGKVSIGGKGGKNVSGQQRAWFKGQRDTVGMWPHTGGLRDAVIADPGPPLRATALAPALLALGVGPRPTCLTIPHPRGRALGRDTKGLQGSKEKSTCSPKPWGPSAWAQDGCVRDLTDAGACTPRGPAVFPAIVSYDGRAWVMRAEGANRIPGG